MNNFKTLFLGIGVIIASWIAFPNVLQNSFKIFNGFSIFHIPILIFIFPISLLYIIKNSETTSKAQKKVFLLSIGVYSASLYWVIYPILHFSNVPWFLTIFAPILLGSFVAAYTILFARFLQPVINLKKPFIIGLFAGILWGSLELLRSWFLSGFPWLTLSSAFSFSPLLLQTVSIWGEYVFSAILVSLCFWIIWGNLRTRLLATIFIIFILSFGFFKIKQNNIIPNKSMKIALIQGNIPQNQKWNKKFLTETIDKYINLTKSLNKQDIALSIWPETALPFYIRDNSEISHLFFKKLTNLNMPIITGAPDYKQTNNPKKPFIMFNSAFFINTTGKITQRYNKQHLVPFGEYVPWFLPFLSKIVEGVGDFEAGNSTIPLQYKEMRLGMEICYEAAFPEISQHYVQNNANILGIISNDAWFDNSSAAWQNLGMVVIRAVEQNRFAVRATNTGISAIISNTGQIINSTLINRVAVLNANIQLIEDKTLFHILYNFWHIFLVAGFLGLWLYLKNKLKENI